MLLKVEKLDKLLFRNQYLAVIEREGYTFATDIRCNGEIISIVPFRVIENNLEYLARLEICPAHGLDFERCSITGGVDPGTFVEEAALQELWEEAGYKANVEELISLGSTRPSKSMDTVAYLFGVDVTSKLQVAPLSDGSVFEANSTVNWVNHAQGVQLSDPLFVTAITRLKTILKEPKTKGVENMAIKATKLSIGLPFDLGKIEFEPDEVQQRAAWSLYVELTTRAASQTFELEKGSLREVLNSLYSMFELTREILREAGPSVAKGSQSFGPIAIDVLNVGIRPFTTKWHQRLLTYEQECPEGISQLEHEQSWEYVAEMQKELKALQEQMEIYAKALSKIAGIK